VFLRFFEVPTRGGLLLLYFLVTLLWSNVHSSVLLLPFILASVAVTAPVALFASRFWLTFRFIVLWLLALFVSPYFGLQVFSGAALWVNEFSVGVLLQKQGGSVFHWDFSLLLVLLGVLVLLAVERRVFPRKGETLPLVVFSIVSLVSRTAVPWALVMCGYAVASQWGRQVLESDPAALRDGSESKTPKPKKGAKASSSETKEGFVEGISALSRVFCRLPSPGLEFLLGCIIIVNVVNYSKLPAGLGLLPLKEADYILDKNLKGPILNHPDVGGFLQWRFGTRKDEAESSAPLTTQEPEVRPAADHRTVGINPRFGAEILRLYKLDIGWENTLYSYQPRVALVRTIDPLYQILIRLPQWHLVHENGSSSQGVDSELSQGRAANLPLIDGAGEGDQPEPEPLAATPDGERAENYTEPPGWALFTREPQD
jgi:hypothetical protein